MNRDKLGIYVWTSDNTMQCLPAWCYLFNKFWPYKAKAKVLGYKHPEFDLPDNFEFVSLGKQRGPKYWSDDMLEYYKSCENEIFYSMWEDGFILDKVDEEILDKAIDLALQNKCNNFFRFCLTLDVHRRPHHIVKNYKDYSLIEAYQTSQYRQSTQHSIWRTSAFVKKLKKNQSPWDFEMDNLNAMNDGLDVYATKGKFAIKMGHGYLQGKKIHTWYEEHSGWDAIPVGKGKSLSQEDINYIESNGWMPERS
tara:strand:- start:3854 stop:4609 length:756 start_codon:yes stop_codon:yes gene_type:complete